jgi:hypothetical protein
MYSTYGARRIKCVRAKKKLSSEEEEEASKKHSRKKKPIIYTAINRIDAYMRSLITK